jgi:hypothetical protein
MQVTNLDDKQPGHILSEVVRVAESPAAKRSANFRPATAPAHRVLGRRQTDRVRRSNQRRDPSRRDDGEIDSAIRAGPRRQFRGIAFSPDGGLLSLTKGRLFERFEPGEIR